MFATLTVAATIVPSAMRGPKNSDSIARAQARVVLGSSVKIQMSIQRYVLEDTQLYQ